MAEDGMRTRVGGTTRTVGVIGWPVSGSLSPRIHNAAFDALDLDWVYVPLPVPPRGLPVALAGLATLGFVGANVTMPHKTEAAEIIDELSEDSARLRAVNTIVVDAAGLHGHNTDAPGFDRFLRRDAGFDPAGASALIYGAGGAARACALALARAGLVALTVAARDPSRAEGIRLALEGLSTDLAVIPFDEATLIEASLVVNATPLGASGESLPLPPLVPGTLVVDLLYRPAITPLQAAARAAGAAALGGLGLLLHQAALSFELWTGRPAPVSVMSAAATAELNEPDSAGN
ncbi:MAG: shikimate dehydrogenase [Actinomycetota bacterium]